MSKLARLVTARPRVVLVIMLAASAVAVAGISRLRFDGSLESLTLADDPARRLHAEVQDTFGDQEIGVVAILHDDVYEPEVLEALRSLTKRVEAVVGVARTLSLANASDPVADVITPPPLLERGPVTVATAARLRERVAANPIYVPHLVARDGRAAAVNVFFARGRSAEDEMRIDREIARILDAYDGPGEVYYTGMSHIRVRATEVMRADLMRFLPLSLLAMMAVLWLSFRSMRAVVLPLAVIAIGVGILLGLMGWAGDPITLATLVLPSLLVVIGGSYAVHVTAVALERRGEGVDVRAADTISRIGLPVAASAVTTAVGFGSLALHPIPAISGLGLYAVLGILVMAGGALLGLALAFEVLPQRSGTRAPQTDAAGSVRPGGRVERTCVRLAEFAVRRRRLVFTVAFVLAVAAIAGAARVTVSTDLVRAFRAGSDVRTAYELIATRLAGPNPVSIVLSAEDAGYFRSIVALRRVRDLQEFLESLDAVDSTLSIIDYLDELDRGLRASGGDLIVDDAGRVIEKPPPPSFWDAPAQQLPEALRLLDMSPKTFSGVVDGEFRRVRVTARTAVSGSQDTRELVRQIESYADAMLPRSLTLAVSGNLVVIGSVSDRILSGQIESVALAFTVIFAVLVVLFLSFRVGVAAMVPNVVPILLFFGVMGFLDIELNLATSIIAAVALGIAVDDTIHYMARLNRVVKQTPSHHAALSLTMQQVARPVVATSVTLTAGFLVMVLSGFALISAFGWLSAMTMLIALATNVVLLPAMLATVPVVSVWDLVAFRLGPRPHRTIPLFEGLGPFAVRLVVLLGKTRSYAPGDHVMRRGEPGSEMYLVLSGSAQVRGGPQGSLLATLERGDVVGEMGLLRRTVRTADVVARSPLDVLVIDEAFLRRLQVRYPRFASRFFLNIARILSNRLEDANRRLGMLD